MHNFDVIYTHFYFIILKFCLLPFQETLQDGVTEINSDSEAVYSLERGKLGTLQLIQFGIILYPTLCQCLHFPF